MHDTSADIARIMATCAQAGSPITPAQAERLWRAYSDTLCAIWLSLPDSDAALWACILRARPDLAAHGGPHAQTDPL